MNITLRQLQAFVAVAELGGFTAAAERLHVTQSALSVMIRGLEGELGLRLFDRTTRTVALTDAGRELYPLAEKTLEDLSSAVAHSRELADVRRGRVTIAATTLVSSMLLPRAIARFGDAYPGIRVALRDGASPAQIAAMVAGSQVDIGIAPRRRRRRRPRRRSAHRRHPRARVPARPCTHPQSARHLARSRRPAPDRTLR